MKPSRRTINIAAVAILLVALYFAILRGGGDKDPTDQKTGGAAAQAKAPPGDASLTPSSPTVPWTTAPVADPADVAAANELLRKEGARTDATLSTFPARAYRRTSQPAGSPAGAPPGEASIHVPGSGLRVALQPNQIGEFPEVPARLSETIGVRLSLPDAAPGTPVRVVLIDGGSFPSEKGVARVLDAAKWGGVAFEFTTSANIGHHRILVEAQGHPARMLNFSAHDATWPPLSQIPAN